MKTLNPILTQHPTEYPVPAEASPSAPWQYLASRFDPISLAQMDAVALMNRTDTKFVMTEGQLFYALSAISDQYRVLEINGTWLNPYRNLYFDTADFSLYLRHHADGRNRYKVRSREYVDSELSFLEIKCKVDKNRTVKNRLRTPKFVTHFIPETGNFIEAHTPLNAFILEPKLWNDFSRMTLVSKNRPERLTLDLSLQFANDDRSVALPGVAIAEVKQDGVDHNSDFMRQMRAMNIRPTGFSKYCVGVSMLYEDVKHNNFKRKLRLVNKLMRGQDYAQPTH